MFTTLTHAAMVVLLAGSSGDRATADPPPAADPVRGQLIVFARPGASALAESFRAQHLPAIRQLAHELGVVVAEVDVQRGAPADVTITPLLVYQNHRGRSVYQGRYTTYDRVRTFVRTARLTPQGTERLHREGLPVWRTQRATVAAPLKIAGVTGDPPADYTLDSLQRDAQGWITGAFKQFRIEPQVSLGRADRLFYLDFYPWCAKDGTLYLSVKLFSQFHCHTPIWTHNDKAFVGPWKERAKLYAQAALAIEQAVLEQMAGSKIGDGFDPVPRNNPVKSWEELGFGLPAAPAGGVAPAADVKLPETWTVAPAGPDAPPSVQFRFAPPLDGYAGEARQTSGELRLPRGAVLSELRGWFEADPRSVTMGEADLDQAIQSSLFLETAKYPRSRFVIERVSGESAGLKLGEPAALTLEGKFELKGVQVPLTVRAVLEPTIDEAGAARLVMQASFQLDLKTFKLDGPDGPAQARETLLFDVNLLLR